MDEMDATGAAGTAADPAPTEVLKVGSTSVSFLAAHRLSQPVQNTATVLRLLEASDRVDRLNRYLDALAAAHDAPAGRRLAALGEVGRRYPGLAEALRQRGWQTWTLSGEEEARAAWWGEQAFWPVPIAVLDVGGGSTEFAGPLASVSVPVGAARPPNASTPALPVLGASKIIALGGSARALAALLGNPLTRSGLEHWATPDLPDDDETLRAAGIDPARRPLLDGGAHTLRWALEALQQQTVFVSARDLRWGLWLAARLGRSGDHRDG